MLQNTSHLKLRLKYFNVYLELTEDIDTITLYDSDGGIMFID
jgi:hypothetical protein